MNPFHFDAEPLPRADSRRVIVPAGIESKAELLAFLNHAMSLPGYFGHNWDALEECLTDPDWLDDKALILAHQDLPLEKTPDDQKTYVLVLRSIALETADHLDIHFPEACRLRVMKIISHL